MIYSQNNLQSEFLTKLVLEYLRMIKIFCDVTPRQHRVGIQNTNRYLRAFFYLKRNFQGGPQHTTTRHCIGKVKMIESHGLLGKNELIQSDVSKKIFLVYPIVQSKGNYNSKFHLLAYRMT